MQFSLSDELEMTRSVIRDFAEGEVAGQAIERDEREQFDRSLFDKMGQLGLTAIPIAESHGGAGSNWMTYAIVVEELARVCASTAAALACHTIFTTWPLYHYGRFEGKQRYLMELGSGSKIGSCALPITCDGKIASSIRARRKGDDWELNGNHSCVMQAEIADYCLVFAQTTINRRKQPQLNVFLLENDMPGWHVKKKVHKMGLRSLLISEIQLDHCRLSLTNRIGEVGQGYEICSSLIDIGHVSAASLAVGIAQGAFEAAVAYAKERKQFGTIIGKQQGISFKLSDMAAQLEAARLLAYQAAWRLDEGLSFSKEAAIARKFASETAVSVAIEAVQIFGGYGYMQHYRMERFLRDAKCMETELGMGGMKPDYMNRILLD